jgi:hypothetical protein
VSPSLLLLERAGPFVLVVESVRQACLNPDCGKCIECVYERRNLEEMVPANKLVCFGVVPICKIVAIVLVTACSSSNNQLSCKSAPATSTPATAAVAATVEATTATSSLPTIDKASSKAQPNSTSSSNRSTRSGGIAFRRPASLLEERSLKRARLSSSEDATTATKLPPVPIHICGLPIPEDKVGVCGGCGEGGEDENETILLCDGEGYVHLLE